MELNAVVLYNQQENTEKRIKEVEWYSKDFICYKYNNELEIGLLQACVGFDKKEEPISCQDISHSKELVINGDTLQKIPAGQIDQFIDSFMKGGTIEQKN